MTHKKTKNKVTTNFFTLNWLLSHFGRAISKLDFCADQHGRKQSNLMSSYGLTVLSVYCSLDFVKRLQILFRKAMEKADYQVIKILLKIYNASQKASPENLVKMME